MEKICIIYYATVVESDGQWAVNGSKDQEPVRVEGREPLGKEPVYCCPSMKTALDRSLFYLDSRYTGEMAIRDQGIVAAQMPKESRLAFCPYCGATVVLVPDLKIRSVAHEVMRHTYDYEVVK